MRFIPLEAVDWLLVKVQLYIAAQQRLRLNHFVLRGGTNAMDFSKTVRNDNILIFTKNTIAHIWSLHHIADSLVSHAVISYSDLGHFFPEGI